MAIGFGAFFLSAYREEVASPLGVHRPAQPTVVSPPAVAPQAAPMIQAPRAVPELDSDRDLAYARPPAPPRAARVTIYLCKSYAGATFWTSGTCSSQGATIDRMSTVPGHLTFSDQVAIASREASAAAQLYVAPPPATAGVIGRSPGQAASSECAVLEQEIVMLDASARQPQSAQMQDLIAQRRKEARDRQFRARC